VLLLRAADGGGSPEGSALELPSFVCVLFVGVLLRNVLAALGWYVVFERCVSVLGNVSLSLFLAMALMSLRLWELATLALPMLILLASQTALMATYAIVVTFKVMGRNHDAAVIAAGHCGFGLGATPTAIANMQAVTERFGPSHASSPSCRWGAFYDIANARTIVVSPCRAALTGRRVRVSRGQRSRFRRGGRFPRSATASGPRFRLLARRRSLQADFPACLRIVLTA
jgi:ESS family glutamate:Na+ symporter